MFQNATLTQRRPIRRVKLLGVERLNVVRLSADCPSVFVRRSLAENSDVGAETLRILAADVADEVRISAAENPRIPESALLRLVLDRSVDVRYALAENARMPAWALGILSEDENPYVACRAEETLRRVADLPELS